MSLAGEMLSGIAIWLTRGERKQQRDDAALETLLLAVTATQTYSASLEKGGRFKPTTEAALARKWAKAAVAIHRTDPDLAQRLQLKAEYWTNPRTWTDRDVDEAGIHLRHIAEIARTYLGKK